MATYGVVLITVGSEAEGQAIAQALVAAKLAACVNFFPIQSVYTWQGEICQDPEWQLVIKTDLDQFDALAAKVQELHSYDLPEVLAWPVATGLPAYLEWLGANVASSEPSEPA
ncbi:MAG: divalent-cation tolerance protein CutA [Spirulinaceae cyanobacterium SM2_1_0]|nr:divalent-cation tolerance protein CutA [Spirulinaceae cyanobacterium SM2_1_0]